MPAMPMAESSPPIVVGIRQTSSATSTVTVIGVPCPAACNAVDAKTAAASRRRKQKDDRHRGQQDVEGDFVGRLLPLGAFDQRDHAVEECFARVGGDAHDQPIGEDACAAGDAAAVAAAFADDGGAFAGDGAFVDRGDAFDDFAVAGNEVAGFDEDDIVLAQQRRPRSDLTSASVARLVELLGRGRPCGVAAQRVGLGLAAAFGHRFGEIGEEHREPQPGRDAEDEARPIPRRCRTGLGSTRPVVRMLPTNTVNITGLRTWRRGSSLRNESTSARRTIGGSNSGRAFVVAVIY